MKKHIPNFITCMNILSGCVGIVYALDGNYTIALIAVLCAAVFDFMDGFAARLLKAYSAMGKELDSICDVVSFGVLPAAMLYHSFSVSENLPFEGFEFIAFAIAAFSALRLAKFNVDTRQSESFLGLAVPANALFWVGAVHSYDDVISNYIYIVVMVMVLFCWLLVSEVPMFSLKIKNLRWGDNKIIYIFLVGVVALLVAFELAALPFIILWYIALSIVSTLGK